MNDFRFRRLAAMQVGRSGSTMDLRVPLPRTLDGHVNHRCPDDRCQPGSFQLGDAPSDRTIPAGILVRRQPGTAGTTCPYCGLDASNQDFVTEEDKRAALEQVEWAALADVQEHFGKMLDDMARGSRGFLKVTKTTPIASRPAVPERTSLPRAIRCNVCQRVYGVYARALFCPDCGSSNVLVHFDRTTELILTDVEEALAKSSPEIQGRRLRDALENIVSALESTLKSVHAFAVRQRFPSSEQKTKLNVGTAFQRVSGARDCFSALGIDPLQPLTDLEQERLELALQKRHVITHNDGVIDEKFIRATGNGRAGELVSATAAEIDELVEFSSRMIAHVENSIVELKPTPVSP